MCLYIITATKREGKILDKIVDPERVCVSGVGSKNAEEATEYVISKGAKLIISFGTACGLNPSLRKGTIIIPDSIRNVEGEKIQVNNINEVLKGLKISKIKIGNHISVEDVLLEPEEKIALFRRTGCISADMESFFIAKRCMYAGVSFLCIRAISDTAYMKLPNWLKNSIDNSGNLNVVFFLKGLLKNLSDIKDLILLTDGFIKAKRSLRYVMRRICPSLPD